MESRTTKPSLKQSLQETFVYHEEAYGTINADNFVKISHSKVGKELISDSFGPCLAVLAILNNGEYGLYHAFSCSQNSPFMRFVELIKDKVEHIFLFQKSSPPANLTKAPYLAMELGRVLDCEVKRIHVENYTGIYVNADNKEVILFKKQSYIDGDKTNIIFAGKKNAIDINNYIGMKSTAHSLFNSNKTKYKKCKGGFLLDNIFIVPDKFNYGYFS